MVYYVIRSRGLFLKVATLILHSFGRNFSIVEMWYLERLMTSFSSGGSRQILILPGLDTTTTTATKLHILCWTFLFTGARFFFRTATSVFASSRKTTGVRLLACWTDADAGSTTKMVNTSNVVQTFIDDSVVLNDLLWGSVYNISAWECIFRSPSYWDNISLNGHLF